MGPGAGPWLSVASRHPTVKPADTLRDRAWRVIAASGVGLAAVAGRRRHGRGHGHRRRRSAGPSWPAASLDATRSTEVMSVQPVTVAAGRARQGRARAAPPPTGCGRARRRQGPLVGLRSLDDAQGAAAGTRRGGHGGRAGRAPAALHRQGAQAAAARSAGCPSSSASSRALAAAGVERGLPGRQLQGRRLRGAAGRRQAARACELTYVRERKPLGTAGALSLLPEHARRSGPRHQRRHRHHRRLPHACSTSTGTTAAPSPSPAPSTSPTSPTACCARPSTTCWPSTRSRRRRRLRQRRHVRAPARGAALHPARHRDGHARADRPRHRPRACRCTCSRCSSSWFDIGSPEEFERVLLGVRHRGGGVDGGVGRWAGRRVLVTGGEGFIGSHLVERLLAEGAEVRVLVVLQRLRRSGLARPARPRRRGAARATYATPTG